jgi:uncharacterized membrane protein YphA (DoxX/SURF4 family)
LIAAEAVAAHLEEERMEAVGVPVDLLHWVLAILSIVALLVFLVPLRWRAPEAAPMAMFTAAIVALAAFRTPWKTLAVAGGKGVWDAIFISVCDMAGPASLSGHKASRGLRRAPTGYREV